MNYNNAHCNSDSIVSIFLSNYESITERVTEIRRIIEKLRSNPCNTCEELYYIKYLELFKSMYNDLMKLSIAEEDLLFRELKNVLPDTSSVRALKFEQEEVFSLCELIHNFSNDKNKFIANIETIEHSILKLNNLLERIFHKKNIVLHHEALQLLDFETLTEIAKKLETSEINIK